MDTELRHIDPPTAALEDDLPAWLAALGSPVWFRVPGRDRSRCRVVCTLLHGNEPSGARALLRWLAEGAPAAVDVLCVIAAVPTALRSPCLTHRQAPDGLDLNRCFGAAARDHGNGATGRAELELARAILETLAAARPEAIVDIHNTSGHGPAYAITTGQDPRRAALTLHFTGCLIVTDLRLGTLMEAVEPLCPAITFECGGAQDPRADQTAYDGLMRYLQADALYGLPVVAGSLSVLEHPLRIELAQDARLAFGDGPLPGVDVTLRPSIERHNFGRIAAGTRLGFLGARGVDALTCRRRDQDIAHALFEAQAGELVTKQPLRLLMVTTRVDIAQSDCLFYAVRESS